MATNSKYKFKIHQVRQKRASGKTDSTFKVEVLQKGWFGRWWHKAWVRYDGASQMYIPDIYPGKFIDPRDFVHAIRDVENFYKVQESRRVVSTEKTDYIYEKNDN